MVVEGWGRVGGDGWGRRREGVGVESGVGGESGGRRLG